MTLYYFRDLQKPAASGQKIINEEVKITRQWVAAVVDISAHSSMANLTMILKYSTYYCSNNILKSCKFLQGLAIIIIGSRDKTRNRSRPCVRTDRYVAILIQLCKGQKILDSHQAFTAPSAFGHVICPVYVFTIRLKKVSRFLCH